MGMSPKDPALDVHDDSETNHYVWGGCMAEVNGPRHRIKDTRQNPETPMHLHNKRGGEVEILSYSINGGNSSPHPSAPSRG